MIIWYALGPLGLLAAGMSIKNLWFAWTRGELRGHGSVELDGWIRRTKNPKYFWFHVVVNCIFALWFGFVGIVVLTLVVMGWHK